MINKFDYITAQEKAEWETVYFAVMSLQFDIQQSIENFKTEMHQVFDEVKDETT